MKRFSFVLALAFFCGVVSFLTTTTALAGTPRYVVLDGYDDYDTAARKSAFATLSLLPTYKDNAALLPLSADVLEKNPDIKVLIVPLRSLEWRGTGDRADTMKKILGDAYAAGTHILIYGETYLQGADAIGEKFFKEQFGAKASFLDLQEKYDGTTLTPFTVKGGALDELGSHILLNANTKAASATRNIGSIVSERSSVIPFLFYDNDNANIAGVRLQGAKARAILLSFRLESVDDETQRKSFLEKMLNWLTENNSTSVEQETMQGLSINPNPAGESLHLHFASQGMKQIRLVDLLGRIVVEEKEYGGEHLYLDVWALPKGSYYVQVQSGTTTSVRPLIIER